MELSGGVQLHTTFWSLDTYVLKKWSVQKYVEIASPHPLRKKSLTDLAALRYDIDYCNEREDESGISWSIVGRFKARNGVLDCYMIPIAGTTQSGIQFFMWTQRFLSRLGMERYVDGWAFKRSDRTRAKASDYWDNIFGKLEKIQATTDLIDSECKIWDDYGVHGQGDNFSQQDAPTWRSPSMKLNCNVVGWRTEQMDWGQYNDQWYTTILRSGTWWKVWFDLPELAERRCTESSSVRMDSGAFSWEFW